MNILVLNLGSTSLKYKLFQGASESALIKGRIERIGCRDSTVTTFHRGHVNQFTSAIADHSDALVYLLDHLGSLAAAGEGAAVEAIAFKAVHAGPKYRGTFLVDDELLASMEEFRCVAPLHNAIYLKAMRSFRASSPQVPIIAAFETGFHSTMPEYAQIYGIPYEWTQKFGIRRFGFHGASHSYIAARLPQLLNRDSFGLRVISCHLGGSSSVCAIRDGKSLDCSFGFSPQSGIDHATRNGDLDPFVIRFVAHRTGEPDNEVLASLAVHGGLLGISGISSDCRDLERASAEGNSRARLALEVLVYTVRKYIGAFVAVLGGLDALVFTGGIGENSAYVRQHVCQDLQHFGLAIDASRNAQVCGEACDISSPSSDVRTFVIATDEELVVAREAARVLANSRHSS